MLKIRLARTGKRGQPSYRIVVVPERSKRDGKVVDNLGHYNPLVKPALFQLDKTKYAAWITKGAQPTHTVRLLANKS